MQWISDEDLKTWSRRTDAREIFIDLVGDLIRATVGDPKKFRFPGQSAGTLRGFDGDLETTEAISRVPAKESKWEFGTTSAGRAKAQEDYNKRTKATPPDVMARNAFVMVNLHSWDTPREPLVNWLGERNAEGNWREVHFIDGTSLVSWLEEKPAVAAKYARNVLEKAPKNGALSTDEFWQRYSSSFKPALTEQMLLCERNEEAEQLLQVLLGNPQNFTLGADTDEEVMAFAVAVIRTAPDETRRLLEDRTMIVESFEAAQFLLGKKGMNFLVWKGANELAGALGQKGPTLTAATGVQRKRQGLSVLKRPSASAMAEAMESMGIDRQDGYELAFRCGRSLTIFRRLNPAAGIASPAEWEHLAASLKPVLLAGAWTTDSALDKDIISGLSGGADYSTVETLIRPTLTMSDPPFDKVEQVWQIRAAVDAFPHYGHLVDDSDLERFKAAVVQVLSHQTVEPTEDEKFSFRYRAPDDYSDWLRDGLAYTLMLFAVMPEVGGLQLNGTTPQRYVDDVIRSLPGFAQSHKWILPLLPQLSIVAEAAPVPFLEALGKSLEGQANDALGLFQEPKDNDYLFSATSPHVYVLWALEVLAWNPEYLFRTTIILGKLAALDPAKDSKNGNRPLNSLREIFLPWLPNTDSDLNQRFIAIDGLIRELPDVAWNLLTLLLPQGHETSSPTARPKLRDTTPIQPEKVTFGLVWETESRIMDRVIALAQGEEHRVISLVGHIGNLQPTNRVRLTSLIADTLASFSKTEGSALWHKLRDYVARQESFPDSDWSLKGEELALVKALLTQHYPSDLVAQTRHLFDDWIPHVGVDARGSLEKVESERAASLLHIYAELGVPGLMRLAKTVKMPNQMRQAFYALELSNDDATDLIFALLDIGGECYSLASALSASLKHRHGEDWLHHFTTVIVPRCRSEKEVAWLLANWPNNSTTWQFVASLGADVQNSYWRDFGSLPLNASIEEMLNAIEELRRANRSVVVLNSLYNNVDKVSSKTLLSLLDDAVAELSNGNGASPMLSHSISEVFKELSKRDDLELIEIARREYVYLPLIEDSMDGLSIHALLAQNPAEYVGMIRNVFVSKNEDRNSNPSEEARTRARMSYRLLRSFHTVPGNKEGVIHEPTLSAWISEVRKQAAETGHEGITDECIGQLLAHSPAENGTGAWPSIAVASILERIASDRVERGIEIERFNMRGVYSKGALDGGAQERELADRYRQWAKQATAARTSAMLGRISAEWEQRARQEDVEAEKRKLKR